MNVQKTQNVNFTGVVKLSNEAFKERQLLKPIINYLKHNVGGVHEIAVADDGSILAIASKANRGNKIFNVDHGSSNLIFAKSAECELDFLCRKGCMKPVKLDSKGINIVLNSLKEIFKALKNADKVFRSITLKDEL